MKTSDLINTFVQQGFRLTEWEEGNTFHMWSPEGGRRIRINLEKDTITTYVVKAAILRRTLLQDYPIKDLIINEKGVICYPVAYTDIFEE